MSSLRVKACEELLKLVFVEAPADSGCHYTHSTIHGGVDISIKCALTGKTRIHLVMRFLSPQKAINNGILWHDNTSGAHKICNITTQKAALRHIRRLFK